MPSGSHGSSGGSHGGGSFSSGRSSKSNGGGGSRSRGHSVRVSYGHGYRHSHYVSSGKSISLTALFVFSGFIAFIIVALLFSIGTTNSEKTRIENDYNFYQQIIAKAESNPQLVKDAVITGHFYKDNYPKWYMTYQIQQDDGGVLEGDTFSIYTLEQLKQYPIGTEIKVAVDTQIVTRSTVSINMDYKNSKLSDDWEYISAQNAAKTLIIISVVAGVVLISLLVAAVFIIIKNKKNTAEVSQAGDTDLRRCPYCNAKIGGAKDKCPNCAANLE